MSAEAFVWVAGQPARFLVGLARLPWPAIALFGGLVLLMGWSMSQSARLPDFWRAGAKWSVRLLLAAICMRLGGVLLMVLPAVPTVLWGLSGAAAALARYGMTAGPLRAVLYAWCALCGGVLLVQLELALGLAYLLNGLLATLGLALFVVTYYKTRPFLHISVPVAKTKTASPPAPPAERSPRDEAPSPLVQRLDSDEAQEGADKYTRE